MIDSILRYIAPHYCYGCDAVGSLLCDNCIYDIISEPYIQCLACGQLAVRHSLCSHCAVPYQRAWCSTERSGAVEHLIDAYKFYYAQDAYRVLGDLIIEALDDLPPETVIVPVPTVTQHIRQRGYDHTLLLARYIAKRRNLRCVQPLQRATTTTQRGSSRKERQQQAKRAFVVKGQLDPHIPYLLIDDVVTTGATLYYGSRALRNAGAAQVWVAAVARQPLD